MKKVKIEYNNITNVFGICKNGDCYNLFNNHWWCNILTGESIGVYQDFIMLLKKKYNKFYGN